MFYKKLLLKLSQYLQFQAFRRATVLKRDSSTDAFCEYCKVFKSSYFEEHLRTTDYQLTGLYDTSICLKWIKGLKF